MSEFELCKILGVDRDGGEMQGVVYCHGAGGACQSMLTISGSVQLPRLASHMHTQSSFVPWLCLVARTAWNHNPCALSHRLLSWCLFFCVCEHANTYTPYKE